MNRFLANVTTLRLVDPSRSEFMDAHDRYKTPGAGGSSESSIFGHADGSPWSPTTTPPPDDLDVEQLTV